MRNSTIRGNGLKAAWILLLTAVLAACGSDNTLYNPDGSGTTAGGSTSAGDVAKLVIIPEANEMRSNADGVNAAGLGIVVVALDGQNNVLANAPVTVTTDTGVLTPGSTAKAQVFLTNAQGQLALKLTTGGDPTLRDITVTATSGKATASLVVSVITATTGGSTGVASLLAFPDKSKLPADADDPQLLSAQGGLYSVVVTVVAVSEGRNVVPNVPVELTASSGILLPARVTIGDDPNVPEEYRQVIGFTTEEQLVTDATGRATAILTTGGDPTARTITITATVGGVTSQFTVDVVEPTAASEESTGVSSVDLVSSAQTLASGSDLTSEGLALGALVSDSNGVLIPDVRVNFAIVSGGGALLVLNDGVTDVTGLAGAILTTGGDPTPRTISVQATVTNLAGTVIASDSLQIQVVGGQTAANVNFYASASQMLGNADGQVTLTVVAVDSNNNVLPELPVSFTATSGAITPQNTQAGGAALTNNLGVATAVLTPGGDFSLRNITVTALVGPEGSQLSRTLTIAVIDPNTPVDLPEISTLTVLTSQTQLPVGATTSGSGVLVTAIVQGADGSAIQGVPVSFSVDASKGTVLTVSQAQTNVSGQATAILTATAQATAGTIVTVNAVAESGSGNVSGSATVQLVPNVASITVTSLEDRISSTGTSTTVITATARGANGALLSGVQLDFSASSGALSSSSVATDNSGSAQTTLSLGGNSSPRIITVTATEPGGVSASTQVTVGSAVGSVVVNSDIGSLEEGDQASSASITVVVLDTQNRPIQGQQVTLTASNGGFIQVTNDITDSSGVATATVQVGSAASGSQIVVTASAGGKFDTASIVVTARQIPEPPVAASVRLLASAPQLRTGDDFVESGITLSAIVRDADGVLISDVAVSFSNREVDSDVTNGVCLADPTPGTSAGALQVVDTVTDSTGTARAILTAGGDKRNRCLEVRATAGSGVAPAILYVPVTGTSLSISGPSTVATNADATYTLTLTDGSGNGVLGETITVTTVNGNLVRAISSLAADGAASVSVQTDSSGVARFIMRGTVGDPVVADDPNTPNIDESDTRETLIASVLDLTAQQRASVASVSMSIEPDAGCDTDPSSALVEIALGAACSVNVTLVDSSGTSPIGRNIELATTRGVVAATPVLTVDDGNGNGLATFSVTASSAVGAGPAIFEATADNGAKESLAVEFVATLPNTVEVQAEPGIVAVNGASVIRAIVRDADNNLVKNKTVSFSLNDVSSGSLSAASQVTNSQGVAQITFQASGTPSASNGVTITATESSTGVTGQTSLTVAGRALRITLGTGNQLVDDNTVYRVPYAVIVTDAEGNPPPTDTEFRLAIRTIGYQKGAYYPGAVNWLVDYFVDGANVQAFPLEGGGSYAFGCAQEDLNFNGILDVGEDDPATAVNGYFFGNNNGILDPGNVATVPTTIALDNGVGEFDVVYPQQFGNWVAVELRAVATVAGTETVEAQQFILPVSADDVKLSNTPPGFYSPFGSGGVSDPGDGTGTGGVCTTSG